MPWEIKTNHPSCPANKPYAVVKEGTDEKVGCHSTEAEAKAHVRALYANEPSSHQAQKLYTRSVPPRVV